MVNLDVVKLRSEIDVEKKYVDFSLIRASLTVITLIADMNISLSEPTEEGECRGKCPKCEKDRSFCLNVVTNRFNCFAKGCNLKGGGVIDFFAKLYAVSAKEASHLLACAYGIQPYSSEEPVEASQSATETADDTALAANREAKSSFPESFSNDSQSNSPLTAQHLIASIEHSLDQLKQLLSHQ